MGNSACTCENRDEKEKREKSNLKIQVTFKKYNSSRLTMI